MTAIETQFPSSADMVRCVVAIPVSDEQGDLDACLNALFSQIDRNGRPFDAEALIVVVVHDGGAHDGGERTGRIARHWQARFPEALHIVEHMPPRDAMYEGRMRVFAVETAAMIGGDRPVLLTDPNAVVALDWVHNSLAALRGGADIVAGVVHDPADADPLQHQFRALLSEIDARLDPRPHDPWPRHGAFSFANLALRPSSIFRPEMRSILATVPAMANRLLRQTTLRVRHALEPEVFGTAAVHGAPILEPAFRAFSRARWRGEMRRHHMQHIDVVSAWENRLRVQPGALSQEWHHLGFDALWDRAEQISPLLTHRRLNPADLPEETRQASNLLAGLRSADTGPRSTRRAIPPAGIEQQRQPPRVAAA